MIARGSSGRVVVSRITEQGGVRKGAELARLAGRLCNFAAFQAYVVEQVGAPATGVKLMQHAAQFIRTICGVDSRAMLDHSAGAAYLFHERVRKPFVAWMEARQQ